MEAEKLLELDYEAVVAEKRDRINARLQTWSLIVALSGGFGLASLQSGTTSYVIALFPLLAMCVARFAAHNESILGQLKAYLLKVEQGVGYAGYESYNRSCRRDSVGDHKKALRDALILLEILATVVVVVRLVEMMLCLAVAVAVVEMLAIVMTARYLGEKK